MRTVASLKPEHLFERVPSLLELRQQFRAALLTGARNAAESAIRSIDHHQLDSAVNTHLMRLRMLDQFGDFEAIVSDPSLDRLISLRMPASVRSAVIRAFYRCRVAPHEADGVDPAAKAYRDQVYPVLGGLVALARSEDGREIARCLAYDTWATRDAARAAQLLHVVDPELCALLQPILGEGSKKNDKSLAEAVDDALRRGDIRALQALGPAVLASLSTESDNQPPDSSFEAVRQSLEVLPNPILSATLQSFSAGSTAATPMPQSWSDLLARLRSGDLANAERFLSLDEAERPTPESLTLDELDAALATLEELLTAPDHEGHGKMRWVANVALPAFVEDFVSDAKFPRPDLTQLYLNLLRLWALHRKGSAYAPDGQLLLILAGAVLEHTSGADEEVAAILVDWWRKRPVRAALPFLLEALDLIVDYTQSQSSAQQLWLEGASLVSRDLGPLSKGDDLVWRRLGLRAGFDSASVAEVIPEVGPADEVESGDPLRALGALRIAIVSLHRRPAEEAREMIAERSGATVFVVDETVPGPGTRAAQSADVVLFVWAATKHAVFRAFDSLRERLVYVQGTGSGSILAALERWLSAREPQWTAGAAP